LKNQIPYQIIRWKYSLSPRDLSAWMHTYFQDDEYPNYHGREYKNIQFKRDKREIIVIAYGQDVSTLLEHHILYDHQLFVKRLKINYNGKIPEPVVESLRSADVEITRKPYIYYTPNYLPFGNKEKVDLYYNILEHSLIEKGEKYWQWIDNSMNEFLEDILHSHIFGFLQSVSANFVFNDIDIKIFRPIRSTPTGTRYFKESDNKNSDNKEQRILFKKFDLYFSTNVLMPHLVGLGNSINIGYGTIYRK